MVTARRRDAAAFALALVAAALGACGGDGGGDDTGAPTDGGGEGGTVVVLRNTAFVPPTVSIAKGGSVTWRWEDGAVQHDVAGEGFKSEIKTSGTFSHTFNQSGSFNYICTVHPTMKGTVQVS